MPPGGLPFLFGDKKVTRPLLEHNIKIDMNVRKLEKVYCCIEFSCIICPLVL